MSVFAVIEEEMEMLLGIYVLVLVSYERILRFNARTKLFYLNFTKDVNSVVVAHFLLLRLSIVAKYANTHWIFLGSFLE